MKHLLNYVKKTVYQQLILQLYFSYFYGPIERSLASAYNLPCNHERATRKQLVEDGAKRLPEDMTSECLDRDSAEEISQHSLPSYFACFSGSLSGKRKPKFELEAARKQERHMWNANLPPISPYFRFYRLFSTVVMVLVVIKNVLPVSLINNLGLNLPAHCYTVGRFRMFDLEAEEIGIILSLYHITWRIVQFLNRRLFKIDLIMFLLQEKQAVHNQFRLVGQSYAVGSSHYRDISAKELLLNSIMYYPINYKTYTNYKIRPNRTESARLDLIEHVADLTMVSCSVFMFLLLCLGPLLAYGILDDRHYLNSYPGCDLYISHLNETNQLNQFSVTWTKHRLTAQVADSIENLVIWFDSGAALVLVFPMSYTLNYDILIYCRNLHSKLEDALYRLQIERLLKDTELDGTDKYSKKNFIDRSRKINSPGKIAMNFGVGCDSKTSLGAPRQVIPVRSEMFTNRRETDKLIYELQAQLCDYFYQIESVDMLVSDIMSYSTVIWLITFAYTTYLNVLNGSILLLKIIQGLCFTGFSVVSLYLVKLPRQNRFFHSIICSITALDQSPYKRGFTEILEFYQSRNLSTYTLFHSYPFYSTTYLSIVGYTLSCVSVVSSLLKAF